MVFAQEDFIAIASPFVELCPCSNQAYTITVQNTGSVANSYTLLAGGDAQEWVAFNPKSFILNPGANGNFFVFVNSLCNIDGNFSLDIFITTNNGLTKVVQQTIQLLQCYDYSLEEGKIIEEADESIDYLEHDGPYSLCANEQKLIPILITNNENFENSYRLFLDAPEWANLNVKEVALDAKSSGIFLINLDMTGVEGIFDFKLSAISELGKVQRKKSLEIEVGECYSLNIDIEKESDEVCGGEEKNYEIAIENSGALAQNINLKVEGTKWASLSNDFLQLSPNGEKTIDLNINPPADLSGSYEIEVYAALEDNEEHKFFDAINLDVVEKLSCYKAVIETKSRLTNLYKEDFFSAKVTHKGIREATYEAYLEGPSWVDVSPKTLTLNPSQTGNLNININPDENIDPGLYGVMINVESEDVINSRNVDIRLKRENEFLKNLKSTLKVYQYYIYLIIGVIIIILIFIKPIIRIKNKIVENYSKHKVKKEKSRSLKLARKEKEEEKREKKQLDEERKKAIKEDLEKTKKQEKIFLKELSKKNKIWVYSIIVLIVLAFIGHFLKFYNLKYAHVYLLNFFYGYLYYILIGIGILVILFFGLLLFNYFGKKKKTKKKETKKANNKSKKEGKKWRKKLSYAIAALFILAVLIITIINFDFFGAVKEFFLLYSYYFILGIIILVIIIAALSFYKPLQKFLKE